MENNMQKRISILIVLGLLALSISACKPNDISEKDRSRVHVISLQKHWTELEAKALEWHSDAYLTGVSIPILVDSPRSRELPLSAYFFSVSDNLQMLVVDLGYNGEILARISSLDQPLSNQEITRSDWEVDSVKALDLLLLDKDVKFLISQSKTQCGELTLERWPPSSSKIVTWGINIYDCGISDYKRSGYIDAISGKIVEK